MKLIIDIDEDVRIAISRMGLLRIPDEMQKKVDKAIQHGIPLDKVFEDIKADIADFMAEIPCLGNTKEGWHNSGQRIGLEQACEIIDRHIREDGE